MPDRFPRYEDLNVFHVDRVSAAEMADMIDELSRDFYGIRTYKENWRPAAGGLGLPEAAIAFIFATTAVGFLKELGADVYRKLRGLLWERYAKWRNDDNTVFRYRPMCLIVGRDIAGFHFVFDQGLEEDDFMEALVTIGEAAAAIDFPEGNATPWWYEFAFDPAAKAWRIVYQEVSGQILLNERNYRPLRRPKQ